MATRRAVILWHFDDNINNNRGGADGDNLNNNARLPGIAKSPPGHFILFRRQAQ